MLNLLKKFLINVWNLARYHKIEFITAWFIFLVLMGSALYGLGLVPSWNADSNDASSSVSVSSTSPNVVIGTPVARSTVAVVPTRIVIDKVQLDSPILNPRTANPTVLDDDLTKGVVHYPGSGNLNDVSNMFFFGHSSHLAVVHNLNYKIFNGLPQLNLGDQIKIYSDHDVYIYKVSLLREVTADEALVTFSSDKKKLTLSTCNTFGQKSDRFVVEADFVQKQPLPIGS